MQNFILVMLLSAYPVKKFSDQFLYSNHNNIDVWVGVMIAIAVIYFVARNITSAVGISVLIASAVSAFGLYYGMFHSTYFVAACFLAVWILVPKILPAFVRMVPSLVGLAFGKKNRV